MEGLQRMMAQMQQGDASGSGAPGGIPAGMMNMLSGGGPNAMPAEVQLSAEEKRWVTVYPIYFDAKRRFESGCRRVPYTQSCLWPKSQNIEEAAARLTLMHAHEARKTHPRDWENPGRVKVQLFDAQGEPVNQKLKSKKALLRAIAEIIQPVCGGQPPPLPEHPKKSSEKQAQVVSQAKPPAGKGKAGTQVAAHDNRQQPYKNASVRGKSNRHRVSIRVDAQERVKAAKRAFQTHDRKAIQGGKLPVYSPMREAGVLNTDLGGMMGPAMQGMGPLGAMMGSMGLGDDDDDDEQEAAAAAGQEDEKKKKDPMQQLSRRQRKRVIRVGR